MALRAALRAAPHEVGIAADGLVVVFDAGGVLADEVVAELEDCAIDYAVMCPESGFAVADDALVCVDAHEEESVYQEGRDFLNFHRGLSQLTAIS